MDGEMYISMIVPMYKGNQYLKRILCMFEENYLHFKEKYGIGETELILVNDYPQKDICLPDINLPKNNIKVVSNRSNIGIQKSKVAGLKESSGKYVFFLIRMI